MRAVALASLSRRAGRQRQSATAARTKSTNTTLDRSRDIGCIPGQIERSLDISTTECAENCIEVLGAATAAIGGFFTERAWLHNHKDHGPNDPDEAHEKDEPGGRRGGVDFCFARPFTCSREQKSEQYEYDNRR